MANQATKKTSSTTISLVLHIVFIVAALLFNTFEQQVIVPSRSDGMEVSFVAPAQLNPTSKVVTLEKNVQEDRIQDTEADINFKQQLDKKKAEDKLLQQKKNDNTPIPPVAVPQPDKSPNPAKANKTQKPTPNKQIDDLLNDLSPASNAGRSKGNAAGGSNLGTSDTDNLIANYADQVIARVRPFIQVPDGLDSQTRAVVEVTLLPNMNVYKVRLVKSSGNTEYDINVQQAINRAAVFPPLPDGAKFADYRKIKLTFRPE